MGDACITQIIDDKGVLHVSELKKFMKKLKLKDGLPYAVVSIIGPQSSGKSTLLNNLFATNFVQMDSKKRRARTTQGIWLAKAQTIETCTLVMDIEGTDGRERGEDDTAFEKQSALFALAVSDTILINMWFHDIGRERAGNRPLFKTVFQASMRMTKFNLRKKTILFVVRDKSATPILEDSIASDLTEDIQKIWDGIPKRDAYRDTPFSDVFNVEVRVLPSYEDMNLSFQTKVSSLRDRFQHLVAPTGSSGNQDDLFPASGFPSMTQQIWKDIQENKDLDLPSHKVMAATVRCGEIRSAQLVSFTDDKEWKILKEAVKNDYLEGFRKTIKKLLDRCLSKYDEESKYYDEGVRTSTRWQLESEILQLVNPAYQYLMGHLRTRTLEAFKKSFDKALKHEGFRVATRGCTQSFLDTFDKGYEDATIQQAKWDPTKFKDELKRDISVHVESIRTAELTRALEEPVKSFLVSAEDNTWSNIRNLLHKETKAAVADIETALSDFKLNEGTEKELASRLENHGRNVIELKAKEEAATSRVLRRMKDRFLTLFNLDAQSMPRVWTGQEDIKAITETARSECEKMLLIMDAVRLDEDGEKIPEEKILISDVDRKLLMTQFYVDTAQIVGSARAAQNADMRDNRTFWSSTVLSVCQTSASAFSGIAAIINMMNN